MAAVGHVPGYVACRGTGNCRLSSAKLLPSGDETHGDFLIGL